MGRLYMAVYESGRGNRTPVAFKSPNTRTRLLLVRHCRLLLESYPGSRDYPRRDNVFNNGGHYPAYGVSAPLGYCAPAC